MMQDQPTAFAIYRLPHDDHATLIQQTCGEPEELHSCTELNGKQGFVLAPFAITSEQPILVIRPDRVESLELSTESFEFPTGLRTGSERATDSGTDSRAVANSTPSTLYSKLSDYAIDFANFHAQLEAGTFRKIVLARCANEETVVPKDPTELFSRACERYPRMFIALVYTKRSGYWLTATPEILLEGSDNDWHTIALAGTMKLEGEQLSGEGETMTWSTKNIQEQRYVTTYITECLEHFTGDFCEEGPYTVRAANLVHLRSDFTFTLPDTDHLGDLLHALHPTPAICGLPKNDAFRFILHNEHSPRRYYSGFMGPIGEQEAHLYVSLRCMNIEGRICHLYAGGGLLKDSTEHQEWQETEAKLETMRSLLID